MSKKYNPRRIQGGYEMEIEPGLILRFQDIQHSRGKIRGLVTIERDGVEKFRDVREISTKESRAKIRNELEEKGMDIPTGALAALDGVVRNPPTTKDCSVPGWLTLDDTCGLFRMNSKGMTEKALPETLLPDKIYVDGEPIGAGVTVVFEGGTKKSKHFPRHVVTSRDPAQALEDATGIAWAPHDARTIQRWLADALRRARGVPHERCLTRAKWEDDKLLIPGVSHPFAPTTGDDWLASYGSVNGSEEIAQATWREIVGLAMLHPKLALVMGAAAASVYLQPLGRDAFILHITGDSRQGKSHAMDIAMSAFGNPEKLRLDWNATSTAATERCHLAAILPIAFDELGAAKMRDDTLRVVVFSIASGQRRDRATRRGDVRERKRWRLVALSTGERSLAAISGESGLRARILELQSPMTPTAEAIDSLHEKAEGVHGWPLRWASKKGPDAQEVKKDLEAIERLLLPRTDNSMARTLAKHIAVSGAGFRALARWCGAEADLDQVITACEEVLKERTEALEEEGVSIADRLEQVVFEAAARYPNNFDITDEHAKERWGMVAEMGDVAILPSVLRSIAAENGIADIKPAIRDLKRLGRLKADEGHSTKLMRLDGATRARVYVFKRPAWLPFEAVPDAYKQAWSGDTVSLDDIEDELKRL